MPGGVGSVLGGGAPLPVSEGGEPAERGADQNSRGWAPQRGPRRRPAKSPSTQFANDSGSSPCRTRTGKPLRARDFKSPASAIPPRGHCRRSRTRAFWGDAEARTGFEPAYGGFANRCLTTWLPRRPVERRPRVGDFGLTRGTYTKGDAEESTTGVSRMEVRGAGRLGPLYLGPREAGPFLLWVT